MRKFFVVIALMFGLSLSSFAANAELADRRFKTEKKFAKKHYHKHHKVKHLKKMSPREHRAMMQYKRYLRAKKNYQKEQRKLNRIQRQMDRKLHYRRF